MSALTIAAVALAAGWVFVRRWLQTRFIALQEIGHPQYFSAGVAAVCLLALGACVHHFTKENFADFSRIEHEFIELLPTGEEVKAAADDKAQAAVDRAAQKNADNLADFAESAGWSLVLAAVLPWLFNLPVFQSQRLMQAMMKKVGAYDAIEQIYAHSLDCGVPLAITLKSGKVYVGYSVATSSLPDVERKWLTLFPLLSGYRDDQSGLELPTNYAQIYGEITQSTPEEAVNLINQFRVVLSFGEVVSIQAFNVGLYYERFLMDANSSSQGDLFEPVESAPAKSETKADWQLVDETNPNIMTLSLEPAKPLSGDERLRLKLYRLYYLGVASSFLLLAFHPVAAGVVFFVSMLFATGSATEGTLDDQNA